MLSSRNATLQMLHGNGTQTSIFKSNVYCFNDSNCVNYLYGLGGFVLFFVLIMPLFVWCVTALCNRRRTTSSKQNLKYEVHQDKEQWKKLQSATEQNVEPIKITPMIISEEEIEMANQSSVGLQRTASLRSQKQRQSSQAVAVDIPLAKPRRLLYDITGHKTVYEALLQVQQELLQNPTGTLSFNVGQSPGREHPVNLELRSALELYLDQCGLRHWREPEDPARIVVFMSL